MKELPESIPDNILKAEILKIYQVKKLSHIEVQVCGGIVTLKGVAHGRKMKHEALWSIHGLPGVRTVENQIKIKRVEHWPDFKVNPQEVSGTVWPTDEGFRHSPEGPAVD